MNELMTYFGCAVLATIIFTAFACRRRTTLHKRISYGTLLLSPLIANGVVFILFGLILFGWVFLSPAFWIGNWALGAILPVLFVIGCVCLLPAFVIWVYYRKKGKKGEAPAKGRKTHQLENVHQGLQCVRCGLPIETGVKFCPECGWTQPK